MTPVFFPASHPLFILLPFHFFFRDPDNDFSSAECGVQESLFMLTCQKPHWTLVGLRIWHAQPQSTDTSGSYFPFTRFRKCGNNSDFLHKYLGRCHLDLRFSVGPSLIWKMKLTVIRSQRDVEPAAAWRQVEQQGLCPLCKTPSAVASWPFDISECLPCFLGWKHLTRLVGMLPGILSALNADFTGSSRVIKQ